MGKETIDEIHSAFARKGRRAALCRLGNLKDLAEHFEVLHKSNQIAPAVFDRYLGDFTYAAPEGLPSARSVLLVASPIGRSLIELETPSGRLEAIIPPTYGADQLIAENEAVMGPVLGAANSRFLWAWLPVKSIAAWTGLGRYGRDNILRFEGLGSFVRLDAWWTELDVSDEPWGPPRSLERCEGCGACARACPNGCIVEGRFIVDAARCLTFLNEGDGDFPEWLDSRSHNAAVGCLRCQDACPENRGVPGREIYRRFALDAAASEALLAGRPTAELPAEAAAAVRAAEMEGHEARLGRNLRALAHATMDCRISSQG
jgi:Uncharacterized Fe-S protein